MRIKFYIDKEGWEHNINLRFPGFIFWGIATLIIMLSKHIDPTRDVGLSIQIASTFFLFQGLFSSSKSQRWRE